MVRYGYRATRGEEKRLGTGGPVKALLSVLTRLNLLWNLPDIILEGAFWRSCGKQT